MKVGFIGLGNLGKAIVKRLISKGLEICVWNRTKEKSKGLDVIVEEEPALLLNDCDIVILNLFDSKAVKNVFEMPKGILSADLKNKIVIDTTTNSHSDVLEFHNLIEKKGGYYLEAPVLGSVNPALQGNLTILVSGNKDAYEKVINLLQIMGSKIFYLGEPGLASKMKLINNLLLGVFMAGISESLVLAEKCGVPLEKAIDILMAGAGNSMVLNAKKEKLLNDDYTPHFSSSLIYKDLNYLQDLAYDLKMPLFSASIVKELYGLTHSKKVADLDFCYLFKLLKELNL